MLKQAKRKYRGMSPDHRARVGKMRRERTEARILQAAIAIFTEKGPDAPVVEDFIRAATISRGTFYNHFSTVQQLLQATVTWLCRDLVESIKVEIEPIDDPLRRLVIALRLGMHKAISDPEWLRFIMNVQASLGSEELRRDLNASRQRGLLKFDDLDAAADLVDGSLAFWLNRQSQRKRGRGQGEDEMLGLVLRGLGAEPARIAALLAEPPPPFQRAPHTFKAAKTRTRG